MSVITFAKNSNNNKVNTSDEIDFENKKDSTRSLTKYNMHVISSEHQLESLRKIKSKNKIFEIFFIFNNFKNFKVIN